MRCAAGPELGGPARARGVHVATWRARARAVWEVGGQLPSAAPRAQRRAPVFREPRVGERFGAPA